MMPKMTTEQFLKGFAQQLSSMPDDKAGKMNLGFVLFDKFDGLGAECILWLLDRIEKDGKSATSGDLFDVLQSALWLIQYTSAYAGRDDTNPRAGD